MRGSTKVPLKKCMLLIVLATLILAAGSGPVSGSAVLAPTGAGYDANTCVDCHSDSSKVDDISAASDWKDSVHYENNIGCERCHSASVPAGRLASFDAFGGSYRDDHVDLILEEETSYKSPSAFPVEGSTTDYSTVVQAGLERQQSVAICARCHGLTEIDPDAPKDVFQDYIQSAHGQSVVVRGLGDPSKVSDYTGLTDAATCVDCHDPHATKAKDDPDSPTNEDNRFKLCISEDCHASDDVMAKYGLTNSKASYDETQHGLVATYGSAEDAESVPGCLDCHKIENSHKILPASDPNSAMNVENIGETCASEDCHGVEFNLGTGSLHGKDKGTTIAGLINLFYTIVIPITVGFFALYILLDFTLLIGRKGGE
jgi:cytochrome c553